MTDAGALPRGRAIVTYGRGLVSLVIAQSLARAGIEVIGCDDVDFTALSFSQYVTDYFTHAPFDREPGKALDDLEDAIRRFTPEDGRDYVLIPVLGETSPIAANRDRFEPLITVAAPPADAIRAVQPKARLAKLAEAENLDIPRTFVIDGSASVDEAISELGVPLLIKPNDGIGGRGVRIINSEEEVRSGLAEASEDNLWLAQEPVDGSDYCLALLAQDGELVRARAYRNLRNFPSDGGAGAMREAVAGAPFLDTAKAVIAATGWDGVAELDFRWNGPDGPPPKLIEVNARFWAGLFHSMESGVDFPLLLYRQAAGHGTASADDPDALDGGADTVTKSPGLWLAAVIKDSIDSSAGLERIKESWSEDNLDEIGKRLAAIDRDTLQELLEEGEDDLDAVWDEIVALKEAFEEGSDRRSELDHAEDPMVGLGMLFAVSSLVRHGRLPAELRYTTEDGELPAERIKRPRRKRPVIGITKPERGDWPAYAAMKLAVWIAGGKPIRITARAPREPEAIDGLIFGGGSDVYPKRYQATEKAGYRYDLAREEVEESWADRAFQHDIPVLGVCRGCQMLNVLVGGTLHQDLDVFPDQDYPTGPFGYLFFRTKITVDEGSGLHRYLRRDRIGVNSIHQQAIDQLGEGLTVTAREDNGLVQAVEHSRHAFFLGVQFHPEFLIYRRPFRKLFTALIDAARAHNHRHST